MQFKYVSWQHALTRREYNMKNHSKRQMCITQKEKWPRRRKIADKALIEVDLALNAWSENPCWLLTKHADRKMNACKINTMREFSHNFIQQKLLRETLILLTQHYQSQIWNVAHSPNTVDSSPNEPIGTKLGKIWILKR